jgi:beta-lysine N6-acetyltransferase
MQPDIVETFGNSIIQHGPCNDRVYLMKAAGNDLPILPDALKELAVDERYAKVFAKVPATRRDDFLVAGYVEEAVIPDLIQGRETVSFMSLFLTRQRGVSRTAERNTEVLEVCQDKEAEDPPVAIPEGLELRLCEMADAAAMADCYDQVFDSYPFPITDVAYIQATMASHVAYFGIWDAGRLIALASAEMDVEGQNAEMTDFATLPDSRGGGLASSLLDHMETEMTRRKIATVYTIARAPSFGINITFARMDYTYGGQLINNTNICGHFEDMNVWYKHLDACHLSSDTLTR